MFFCAVEVPRVPRGADFVSGRVFARVWSELCMAPRWGEGGKDRSSISQGDWEGGLQLEAQPAEAEDDP